MEAVSLAVSVRLIAQGEELKFSPVAPGVAVPCGVDSLRVRCRGSQLVVQWYLNTLYK